MLKCLPNKFSFFTFGVAFSVFLLSGCALEKRHYTNGFYVSNKHKAVSKNEKTASAKTQISEKNASEELVASSAKTRIAEEKASEKLVASASNEAFPENIQTPKRTTIFDSVPPKPECDSIFFRTGGDKIAGKIIEITTTEVKYRKCSNLSGPLFVVKKSDVTRIKYANGVEENLYGAAESKNDVKKPENKKREEKRQENQPISGKKKFLWTALISLICGIVAIFALSGGSAAGFLLYILLAGSAFTFGLLSLIKMKKNKGTYKGQGMALTGLIFGGAELIVFLLVLLVVLALM